MKYCMQIFMNGNFESYLLSCFLVAFEETSAKLCLIFWRTYENHNYKAIFRNCDAIFCQQQGTCQECKFVTKSTKIHKKSTRIFAVLVNILIILVADLKWIVVKVHKNIIYQYSFNETVLHIAQCKLFSAYRQFAGAFSF